MMQSDEAVPITGLGCLCAAGRSVPKLTETLFAGRRCVAWRQVRGNSYPVFQLDSHSVPAGYYEGAECERCGRLAIAAADEALTHAGLTGEHLQRRRVGVCLGTTVGSAMNNETFYRDFRAGRMPGIEPIRRYLRANPATMVAQAFGLTGPCQTITNACSSGGVAIGHAAQWVRAGLCDVAIAGGADMLCNVIHAGFLSLLVTDTEPCRPFDRNRRGLNLGEGAGVVVLESKQSVCERDAPVQAWLCGYGNASDAYHISAPEPSGRGLRRALEQALTQAQLYSQRCRFHQRPRDCHAGERPRRGPAISRYVSRGPLWFHQGLHRPYARSCRGDRGRDHNPLSAGEANTGEHRISRAGPGFSRSTRCGEYADRRPIWTIRFRCVRREQRSSDFSGAIVTEPHPAIIGIGLVGGFGLGKQAAIEALRMGGKPNGTVPVTSPSGQRQLPAYQVDTSPVSRFVAPAALRRMNRFAKIAVLGAVAGTGGCRLEHPSQTRRHRPGDRQRVRGLEEHLRLPGQHDRRRGPIPLAYPLLQLRSFIGRLTPEHCIGAGWAVSDSQPVRDVDHLGTADGAPVAPGWLRGSGPVRRGR